MSNRTDIKNNHISQTTMTDPNVNNLDQLLAKIKAHDYIKHLSNQNQSIMEIVGTGRDEKSHNDFLAWLFDSSKDHGLEAEPANKLIELIVKKASDNELKTYEKDQIDESFTQREFHVIYGDQNGYVDILMDMKTKSERKIRVVFENKVTASETQNKEKGQTILYHDYFDKGVGNDGTKTIYVYNRCDASEPECSKFICITYQDIVDFIIEPLLQTNKTNERTRFILEDYLLTLEKKQKNTIMAIGDNTKQKLDQFIKDISPILATAAKQIACQNIDPENKQTIDEFVASVNSLINTSSKYEVSIRTDTYSSLAEAAMAILQDLAKKFETENSCTDIEPEVLCEKFYDFIHKKEFYGDNKLLAFARETMPSGSFPKKYKITICGHDFRIRTDWYTDERKTQQFQKFLDTIKEKIDSPNIVVTQNGNQIYPR